MHSTQGGITISVWLQYRKSVKYIFIENETGKPTFIIRILTRRHKKAISWNASSGYLVNFIYSNKTFSQKIALKIIELLGNK